MESEHTLLLQRTSVVLMGCHDQVPTLGSLSQLQGKGETVGLGCVHHHPGRNAETFLTQVRVRCLNISEVWSFFWLLEMVRNGPVFGVIWRCHRPRQLSQHAPF